MSYLSEAEEAREKAWEAWDKAREAWDKAREAWDKARKDCCPECGELWNSEYHISDQCVNHNEDKEVKNDK